MIYVFYSIYIFGQRYDLLDKISAAVWSMPLCSVPAGRAISCLPLVTVSSFSCRASAITGGGAELSRSALVSLRSAFAESFVHTFSPSFRKQVAAHPRVPTGDNSPHLCPASPPSGAAQRKKIFAKGVKQRTEHARALQLYHMVNRTKYLNPQTSPPSLPTQPEPLRPQTFSPAQLSLHPTP